MGLSGGYILRSMVPQLEDTKDLREGAGYVAAGKEKFKKLR